MSSPQLKVSTVTDMRGMFKDAISFNQPLNDWNVSNVIDMSGMFWGATSFNQPLDNWSNKILNVTHFRHMFNCSSLNQLPNWFSDVSDAD